MQNIADDAQIVVEGLLVGGDDERLDLVVTPYLFSLERGAVLDLERLEDPAQLVAGTARAVRLRLRAGARLYGLCASGAVEAGLWRRRSSFPVAARSGSASEETLETEEQRELTRAFLERHGIATSPGEETKA